MSRNVASNVARRSASVCPSSQLPFSQPLANPDANLPVVGRLAPSPTGALHLGNARSFLLAWLSVRQQHGQLWLRVEDIDSPRVKPWAVQSTLDDLRWLGIDWDIGPEQLPSEPPGSALSASDPPAGQGVDAEAAGSDSAAAKADAHTHFSVETIQSRRLPRYRQVLEQLIAAGCVYPCTCSRSEVAQAASAPHENSLATLEGPIYPGTCRPQFAEAAVGAPTEGKFAWRWRFAAGQMLWHDRLHGDLQANPAQQLGDFIIAQGDGTPAYQLAVIVDDHDMQVTEVVRGDDLIFSTYRQLAILQHLGWLAPSYVHVPLMLGPDGRRLAKRHGDTRLSTYRQAGVSAEQIVGYLAWTLGLQADRKPLPAVDLIGRLNWADLSLEPTVVDSKQLGW